MAVPPGPANAVRNTRIMALVSVAIYDATIAAWDSKYAYNRPRPSQFDTTLTTVLPPRRARRTRVSTLRWQVRPLRY